MTKRSEESLQLMSKVQLERRAFEKKWGKVCKKCGIRKGGFMVKSKAEGGTNLKCKCDD